MVVGEAPGAEEEREGVPFVGLSGSLLNRYLERHGVFRNFDSNRFDVFATNLCKYRPYKNEFRHLLDSRELEEGIEELKAEIEEVDPNVIITLGNEPLKYLTGESGIMKWRGSVLPCSLIEGKKVYATIHPAAILRMYGMNPVFNLDLGRAVEQSEFPEIKYPEYECIIDPEPSRLWSLVDEMVEAEWLSIDIETFGPGNMSCIGFADREDRGLCITFQCPGGWEAAKTIYEHHKAKKLFQYGTYDINFLDRFYGWQVGNYAFDTYIAAAELMPEFPRGLDFLTSVYTWFPYYKVERKVWKEEGNLDILWNYNIKDIIATYQIAMEQMKELEELYDWSAA
jgi:DNA polymerase